MSKTKFVGEAAGLAVSGGSFCYAHPHPAVATDIVVFSLRQCALHVLLIERGGEPFKGAWALPGGFLGPAETIDACARRELQEETGFTATELQQFAIYSAPERDPRERVISVAYAALALSDDTPLRASTDAARAEWFRMDAFPALAFDHSDIIWDALKYIRSRVDRDLSLLVSFLADRNRFTLRDLHLIFEAVKGETSDRANFRRRLKSEGLNIAPIAAEDPAQSQEAGVRHRPAQYYTVVLHDLDKT